MGKKSDLSFGSYFKGGSIYLALLLFKLEFELFFGTLKTINEIIEC